MELAELTNRFSYHAPHGAKILNHSKVRQDLLYVAQEFNSLLPEGREKSLAMTKLEEAMFWANASIARS